MELKVLMSGRWRITSPLSKGSMSITEEFLDSLAASFKSNAAGLLVLMEQHCEHGPDQFNTAQSHYVDQREQIYEYIKGRLRLFWFEDDDRVVICMHGIIKKDQKTPRQEIERAKRVKAAYMQAKAQGSLTFIEEE